MTSDWTGVWSGGRSRLVRLDVATMGPGTHTQCLQLALHSCRGARRFIGNARVDKLKPVLSETGM